jgi:hypothetical protein
MTRPARGAGAFIDTGRPVGYNVRVLPPFRVTENHADH